MFQRVCLVAIGAFCLLGIIFKPQKVISKIFAFGVTLFSMLGFAIAGRQVWLQHLPANQVPECGPDLEFMMEVFPWQDVIRTVLQGSGECADVQWTFLSVSMPEWMVLVFAFMVIVSIKLLFTKQKSYFSSNYRP